MIPHLSDNEVSRLLSGDLPADELTRAEHHLWHCADCQEALRRRTEPAPDLPPLSTTGPGGDGPAGGEPPDAPPAIPGYEVLGLLGRGGMGLVWKARQLRPARTVALKVLRAGLPADADARRRFRAEAEALASLQHPGIVQVYEVGEQDGRPFFSLEYCAGGSLAAKLAGAPLPPGEAAALVEAVARAVHHAHRQGLVHRDLKPANVLLQDLNHRATEDTEEDTQREMEGKERALSSPSDSSASGSSPLWSLCLCGSNVFPKVTDFGLARWLTSDSAQTTTRSGGVLGTPSYVAPEQVEGTAGLLADVYALGAILYECLTGRPPFKAATVLETLELARTREPLPVRQAQPGVPRDLETVCLKCLEKLPANRYASAEALADDLRRFQEGRPVTARPVSRPERLRRWARRNPLPATLAGVLVLALTAGLTAVLALWWDAERHLRQEEAARREAEDHYATCRELLGEYVAVTRDPRLQTPDARQAQREALRKARAFCEELRRRRPDEAGVRRDLAGACTALAALDAHDGRLDDALEAGETARALWQGLREEAPGDARYRDGLAAALEALGVVYHHLGRYAEAERALRRAVGLWEELADDGVAPARSLREAAWARSDLTALLDVQQRFQEQGRLFGQRCARLTRAARGADSPPELRLELLWDLTAMGEVSRRKKDEPAARRYWREGCAVGRRLVEELPDNAQAWLFLALCCQYLAEKDPADAPAGETARLFERAGSLFESQLRRDPADRTSARLLGAAYQALAEAHRRAGRPAEALRAGRRAAEVLAGVADRQPGDLEVRMHAFAQQASVARLERLCGDPSAARSKARRAADEFTRFCDARSDDPHAVALAGRYVGVVAAPLRHAGASDDALRVSDSCLRLFEGQARKHPDEALPRLGLSEAWTQRGKTLWGQGRHEEAESALRAAVRVAGDLAKRWPEYREVREERRRRLGRFLEERGRTAEAAAFTQANP